MNFSFVLFCVYIVFFLVFSFCLDFLKAETRSRSFQFSFVSAHSFCLLKKLYFNKQIEFVFCFVSYFRVTCIICYHKIVKAVNIQTSEQINLTPEQSATTTTRTAFDIAVISFHCFDCIEITGVVKNMFCIFSPKSVFSFKNNY